MKTTDTTIIFEIPEENNCWGINQINSLIDKVKFFLAINPELLELKINYQSETYQSGGFDLPVELGLSVEGNNIKLTYIKQPNSDINSEKIANELFTAIMSQFVEVNRPNSPRSNYPYSFSFNTINPDLSLEREP